MVLGVAAVHYIGLVRKFLIPVVIAVVIGGGVGALFARGHHSSPGAPPSTSTTTTTQKQSAVAPLTGVIDTSGVSLTRPALTIKVENTPEALPQWGVDQADVVYEEIVNGGITRLASVFNSHAPAKVGPVRSVRPTDTSVVWPFGGIFAYSGGAAYAVQSISQAPVTLIDESSAGAAMFRDPSRYAPHNLYAIAARLFAFKGSPTPPPALFTYRSPGQKLIGAQAAAMTVQFPSIYAVTWTWNPTSASWDRTLFGQPDVTGTNVRESPKNVIVMWINYVNGIGTEQSYGDLQGSGSAEVFTSGREVRGTWSRGPSKSDILKYQTPSGASIALTPGQTWVELLNIGAPVRVTR